MNKATRTQVLCNFEKHLFTETLEKPRRFCPLLLASQHSLTSPMLNLGHLVRFPCQAPSRHPRNSGVLARGGTFVGPRGSVQVFAAC